MNAWAPPRVRSLGLGAEYRDLEALCDREADLLARGDLDLGAGLRIATDARLHLAQLEGSETGDLQVLALLHTLDHEIRQTREYGVGLLAADFAGLGELGDQLRLRHLHLPVVCWVFENT